MFVCLFFFFFVFQNSLDILSQLLDQLDVDVGLQEGGAHLLQHGVENLVGRRRRAKKAAFGNPLHTAADSLEWTTCPELRYLLIDDGGGAERPQRRRDLAAQIGEHHDDV